MKKLSMNKTVLAVALTAAMGFGSTSVMALVLNPFTVNEGSVPGASPNIITNAGGFSGAYTEIATFDGSGNFSTSIKWTAGSIYDTSNNVVGSQLNYPIGTTGYGMYALFVAGGTYVTVANVTTFTFNPGGSLGLFMDPDRNTDLTSAPINGATPWTPGGITTDDYQIASGAALGGTGLLNPYYTTCGPSVLNPTGSGNNCGSFGVNTSFNLVNPNGPLYFTAPSPFYNLSFNSGQLKSFEVAGTQTISGSLDVNFARVPEPATLALMGLGLLGMGATSRRRKSA